MKNIYKISLHLLLLLAINVAGAFFVSTFANENTGTIREMQENIKALKEEKSNLEYKWKSFNLGDFSLGDLISKDLTEEETDTLEVIVVDYVEKQESIKEEGITGEELETIRKEKLLLKRDFYKSLLTYIELEKQSDFKLYIENEVQLNEKSKIVGVEIQQIQEIKNERVEEIQEKIENNNKTLRQNIQQKAISTISEKLESFTENEKFLSLSAEAKITVFSTVQEKIQIEITRLESSTDGTSVLEEKINIYKVIINQLESYIETWEK